jgi:hypothetical protein
MDYFEMNDPKDKRMCLLVHGGENIREATRRQRDDGMYDGNATTKAKTNFFK